MALKTLLISKSRPTESNAVFCTMPRDIIKEMRKKFFFYVWDEKTFEVRLMTSFSTTDEQVDDFVTYTKQLFSNRKTQ